MNRQANKWWSQRSARTMTLWALVALLAAVSQLNESLSNATIWQHVFFWSTRVVAFATCLFAAQWLVSRWLAGKMTDVAWLKPVVLVSAVALVPFAAVELFLEMRLPTAEAYDDHALWSKSPLLAFVSEFATLASVVVPVHFLLWLLIERRSQPAAAGPEQQDLAPPKFLGKTQGISLSDVVALKAEEHYVRIYARDSSELIHFKFGDAVAQLPSQLGLRVHRSWWIADAHVTSSQRGERRWQLVMAGDVEVPVSDRYLKEVRERGHLKRKPRAKVERV